MALMNLFKFNYLKELLSNINEITKLYKFKLINKSG